MTPPLRFRLPLLLAALCASLAAPLTAPLTARAQQNQFTDCGGSGLTVTLTQVDGEDPPAGTIEFSQAQCDGDAALHFKVSGFMNVKKLYVASGDASMCDQLASRDGNDTNMKDCDKVEIDIDGQTNIELDLNLKSDLGCEDSTNGDIWFLAMNTWAENPASFADCLTLPFDNTPPTPPDGLSDRSGGSSVPMSWDASATASTYYVVWEPTTVDSSGNCEGDPAFMAGMSYSASELADLGHFDDTTKTNKSLSRSEVGMDGAWVAVAAADDAGNISALSSIACAHFVDASSFPERFEELGGDFKSGCSALPGAGRRGSGWAWLLGGLLGLSVRRRRA